MKALMDLTAGWKTYGGALVMLALAVAKVVAGDPHAAGGWLAAALSLAGARHFGGKWLDVVQQVVTLLQQMQQPTPPPDHGTPPAGAPVVKPDKPDGGAALLPLPGPTWTATRGADKPVLCERANWWGMM